MMKKKQNEVAVAQQAAPSSNIPQVVNFNYDQKVATLTPAEKEQCTALTQKIDINDVTTIHNYGQELNTVISHNGDQLLASVRADNTNEVVAMTNDLLDQLNLIDIDDLNDNKWKTFLRRVPVLRHFVKSVQAIFNDYDTVAGNVEQISKKIGAAKMVAMRDNTSLEQIFDNNVLYIQQLQQLIVAAKVKEAEMAEEVHRMEMDPNVEAYKVNDAQNFLNEMQKRITDMESEATILNQNLYQIRTTQHNNLAIAQQSDNICNNIIPLWKNQLALAITINNQRASVEAEQKIKDTTNQMIVKMSERLKTNSIDIAKESENPTIKIETFRKATQDLVEGLTEMKRIQAEGSQNRLAYEKELQTFAEQLDTLRNQ